MLKFLDEYRLWLYIFVPLAATSVCLVFIFLGIIIYLRQKRRKAILDYVSVNPEYCGLGMLAYKVIYLIKLLTHF